MMEWSEIKDPENVFVFSRLAWEAVRDSWTPEEIQEMINVDGVMGMVHKVNEYYSKDAKRGKPIRLGHINGQKAVLARHEDNS